MALAGAFNNGLSPDNLLDLLYPDDGELLGRSDLISTAFTVLIQPLFDIGLVLNRSKCGALKHTQAAVDLID